MTFSPSGGLVYGKQGGRREASLKTGGNSDSDSGWEEFFHKYTVANHHVVDFKYLKMLLVNYISIKLFKRIECLSDVRVGF